MAKVICTLCGVTGNSKCPHCRTVFPNNQTEAILSHVLKFPQQDKENPAWWELKIRLVAGSKQEFYDTLIGIVEGLQEVGVEAYCCNHRWDFAPGEKSQIGCGH